MNIDHIDDRGEAKSSDSDVELTERLLAEFPSVDPDAVRVHLALGRAFYRSIRAMEGYVLPDGTIFSRAKSNFLALLFLAEDNQLPVGAIGRELGLSPASATRILDSFEEDGFMVRVPSASDRRITYARLTEQGLTQCQTVLPRFLQFLMAMVLPFTVEERTEFSRLLGKYQDSAQTLERQTADD